MLPYCSFHSFFLISPILSILFITSTSSQFAENHPPTLSLSLSLNEGRLVRASEDTPVNSLLGILVVKDDDPGPAGDVVCTTDNIYVGLVLINVNMYKVNLLRPLDRELVESFEVTIACYDDGVPQMKAKAVFSIDVQDVNDNRPVFDQAVYVASIPENEAESSKLEVNVKANDADAGENGEFEYLLEDMNNEISELFEIDPVKGHIYTLVSLDREEFEEINLIVRAVDFGMPSLNGSAYLKITVLDLNDNHPSITTEEIQVREGLPAMSKIGQIVATDADIGNNGEIGFSMAENQESSTVPPFLIQPDGTVLAAVPLDRELRASYTIDVTATDKGNPPLSNMSAITISVLDINDNPPIILQPQDENNIGIDPDDYDRQNGSNMVTIEFYCPQENRNVYQALATDSDEGENGRVTYAITSVNEEPIGDDPLFKIDHDTGLINLRRCLRQTDAPVQILSLAFRDHGEPSLEVISTLNVTLDVDFSAMTSPASTTKRPRQTTFPMGSSATSPFNSLSLLTFGSVSCLLSTVFYVFR